MNVYELILLPVSAEVKLATLSKVHYIPRARSYFVVQVDSHWLEVKYLRSMCSNLKLISPFGICRSPRGSRTTKLKASDHFAQIFARQSLVNWPWIVSKSGKENSWRIYIIFDFASWILYNFWWMAAGRQGESKANRKRKSKVNARITSRACWFNFGGLNRLTNRALNRMSNRQRPVIG